ncbi:tumor necrosis factor ligand superfamily member 13B isoform X2 [Thalassophryne amazonica]|uniref:tumor necrosis factor ligand superfamily member 13B isoform X2 n=1 Tax=Thalassophryne amazonica TaxID=390379 RepID=UPI0014716F2C|nr:tumor necrosis factor ligand superfamily member 13B isoform X2 [Thalassophryne amazonica]
MDTTTSVLSVDGESGGRPGEARLSWPVFLLTLAVVTSSSLSALSLYQLVALRAEVEGLKSDRREERQESVEQMVSRRSGSQELLHQQELAHGASLVRKKRMDSGPETLVTQSCLQFLANSSRKTFTKDFDLVPHTGIPWHAGLKRGTALDADGDSMLVREDGFYFVYSQVYYMDRTFVMGHVVIRRKRNVVGDEPQCVTLFRCVQNMSRDTPYNTCYTGGIVKLDVGDYLELLIPRSTANVSLNGDSTFLGAFKLA